MSDVKHCCLPGRLGPWWRGQSLVGVHKEIWRTSSSVPTSIMPSTRLFSVPPIFRVFLFASLDRSATPLVPARILRCSHWGQLPFLCEVTRKRATHRHCPWSPWPPPSGGRKGGRGPRGPAFPGGESPPVSDRGSHLPPVTWSLDCLPPYVATSGSQSHQSNSAECHGDLGHMLWKWCRRLLPSKIPPAPPLCTGSGPGRRSGP